MLTSRETLEHSTQLLPLLSVGLACWSYLLQLVGHGVILCTICTPTLGVLRCGAIRNMSRVIGHCRPNGRVVEIEREVHSDQKYSTR